MALGYFCLYDDPDAPLRLKAFSSSSRGGRFSIRIEVETDDPARFGFALADLTEVQKGQRRKPKPEPKPKAKKPKMLALPAPLRALPAPDGKE